MDVAVPEDGAAGVLGGVPVDGSEATVDSTALAFLPPGSALPGCRGSPRAVLLRGTAVDTGPHCGESLGRHTVAPALRQAELVDQCAFMLQGSEAARPRNAPVHGERHLGLVGGAHASRAHPARPSPAGPAPEEPPSSGRSLPGPGPPDPARGPPPGLASPAARACPACPRRAPAVRIPNAAPRASRPSPASRPAFRPGPRPAGAPRPRPVPGRSPPPAVRHRAAAPSSGSGRSSCSRGRRA